MARRRRSLKNFDIQEDIRRVRNRASAPYQLSQRIPGVPQESEVTRLQESERFSWEEGQGDFIPLTYAPTKTSWPGNQWHHRRTTAAGYDRSKGVIRIEFFTDGAVYDYGIITPIPPYVAFQFRNTDSPGRFINSTLESYGYERIN